MATPIKRVRIGRLVTLMSRQRFGPLSIRHAPLSLRWPFSFSLLGVVVGNVIVCNVRAPVISCRIGK